MLWNDAFYNLAVLAIALTLAQYGISHLSSSRNAIYWGFFKRIPNRKVQEIMRIMPKFFALITILALFLAIFAAYQLLFGFAMSVSIVVANSYGFPNNMVLVNIIAWIVFAVELIVAFLFLRALWRFAARLPDDSVRSIGDINREIRERLEETKERGSK